MHSPPMKPFVRFARETQHLYDGERRRARWFFWDFDAMVQKVLLGIVRGVSTPGTLAEACKKRWAVNLSRLEKKKWSELREISRTGRHVRFPGDKAMDYITDRLRPNARFLYAGCGAGTECLAFASRGLDVVGIDPVPGLVDVANAWAGHFALPFKAICADAMALDSNLGLFDGFLVEFYGDQPSWNRTLSLQANLQGILTNEGKGFIVATRRKYASYWFRMGTTYSALMTKRLAVQAHFDYRFSQPDKSEEQLRYGLYTKTHTRESLAAELCHSFDILECIYKSDPRYVLCVVSRKQGSPAEGAHPVCPDLAEAQAVGLKTSTTSVDELLDRVQTICETLETNEKKVQEFYDCPGNFEGMSPIKGVEIDYPRFTGLLEEVSAVLPDSEE